MNKNYHDLTDRKDIAETVAFYNSPDSFKSQEMFGKHEFYGKTVDEAIAIWEATARDTEDIINVLYLYAENANLLADDDSIMLVQALLKHPEKHRLRMINDGSYRTHRIWSHIDNEGNVKVTPSICWMNSEFKRMSNKLQEMTPEEQVDFLFKNFEVVYVQIPAHNTREEIERWISWELLDRQMDFVDYSDLP